MPVQTAAGRPWFDTLNIRRVPVVAFLGLAMGVQTLVLHLAIDQITDVRVSYDAGARLSARVPFYEWGAGVGVTPRLLAYQASNLLASLRDQDEPPR